MTIVTLSANRQVTIPKASRLRLGLRPGDRVHLDVKHGSLVIRRQGSIAQETAGSLARVARHPDRRKEARRR